MFANIRLGVEGVALLALLAVAAGIKEIAKLRLILCRALRGPEVCAGA